MNLLENGDLQAGNYNWSYITLAGYTSGVGLFSTNTGARSLRLGGDAYTIVRASQVVPINETGGSYVFSGWAKANAVPDNLDDPENTDPAQDTWKEFGLRAIVTYSDGSTEYHYVPFNSDVTQWQFSSLTIVPKKATTKVATIEVQCVYDKNDNEAYFDNLSLVKEAAQTMAYDENGNLESVQASGSEGESAEYEDGNLTSVTTGGSGTFTYTYDDNDNVATASNGIVKESYTRDSYGNVTSSTMTPDSGSGLTMTGSATYTNGGNLVYTQTDTRGNTVTNSYYNVATGKYDLNYMLGAPYMTTDPLGNKQYYIYDTATGRYQMTYINGVVSTQNNYNSRGLLASVTRAGYYDNNGVNTRVTQDYAMTYDAYGNTTKIEVGTTAGKITLGSYTYAPNNGVLQRMTYGNGDYTDYTYDDLGRTAQVSTSDGGLYTYVYTGDGQLFSISDLTNNLTYRYNYDTLGRLIGSSTNSGDEALLRIQAQYDENSRLSGQSWQMGDKTYSEGFVYDDHGRLTSKSVALANGSTSTMTNTYDALSRLSAQTRPMSRITYSYLAGANGTTTGLVSSVTHSKVGSNSFSPITFGYAYDELGYITSYTQTGKQAVTYDYDVQGQLTSVSDPNQDLYYSYEYDTYGNIRSAEAHGSYHISDDYTNDYEYNNPKWLDLLTGFNTEPILYEGQTLVDGEIVGDPTSGNPISYYNGTRWEFVWENGRQLASASTTDGDTTIDIDYTYDINGLRTSKTITRTTGSGTAHTHEYTSTVTAPTCTTAGYTTYTCDCGESYVDNLVDALGHNYVQSGNVYTCSRCGDSYTGHEHSYTEETTQPTCTTAGYTVYTCSCGDSYTVEIPALGHNYVLVDQSGNVATYECSRCGHRYTAVIPIDPNPPVEYGLRNGNVTVTTEHHEYIYASGKLLREVITTTDAEGNVTTETLDFTYDASGSPYTVTRIVGTSSSTYYYVVNAQGDIIRVVNAGGATVAEYAYDPWGRVISATGTVAEANPLRYRGYYYDAETGFYYVSSRYFDPEIGRWISPEPNAYNGEFDEGAGLIGYNVYAYCANNPVTLSDPTGEFALGVILGKAVIGAAVNVLTTYIGAKVTGQSYSWKDAGVAALAGALGTGGTVLKVAAGVVSGLYTGVTAYQNGADLGKAVLAGAVSAWGTTVSVANIAGWTGPALELGVSTVTDVVFGTASNSIAAATYRASIETSTSNNTKQQVGTQCANNLKRVKLHCDKRLQ